MGQHRCEDTARKVSPSPVSGRNLSEPALLAARKIEHDPHVCPILLGLPVGTIPSDLTSPSGSRGVTQQFGQVDYFGLIGGSNFRLRRGGVCLTERRKGQGVVEDLAKGFETDVGDGESLRVEWRSGCRGRSGAD